MHLILSVGITAALCAILLLLAAWIVFVIGIKAHSNKSVVFGKPRSADRQMAQAYNWTERVQIVQIQSDDGLQLWGYEYRHNNSADWVICIHGYSGCASNMAGYMDHFIRLGYNVLAVDLRGHGHSSGKYYGLGVLDRGDILQWVRYLKRASPGSKVILFGISMGGATALMAGACVQGGVSGVISDSAPADFTSMFRRILGGKLRLLTEPVISLVSAYTRVLAGYWLESASALDSIQRIAVPVLLIHGAADGFVLPSDLEALFAACRSQKEKYLCPNAEHTKALQTNPDQYWEIVDRFLQNTAPDMAAQKEFRPMGTSSAGQ